MSAKVDTIQLERALSSTSKNSAERAITRVRDVSLDWTKGALVAVMVSHHGIEYFNSIHSVALRYLDFVTGAFVFAALFVAGQAGVIPGKGARGDGLIDASRSRRAISRSLKLVVVFFFMNLIVYSTMRFSGPVRGIPEFLSRSLDIFLKGDKRWASFEIVLPIAYALLIANCLAILKHGRLLQITAAALGLAICMTSSTMFFNIYFTTIGLLGYIIGGSVLSAVNSYTYAVRAPARAFTL